MRLSKVDAAKAQAIVGEAFAGGVMTSMQIMLTLNMMEHFIHKATTLYCEISHSLTMLQRHS